MGAGKSLEAWGKHGRFTYQGDLVRGTRVLYRHGQSFIVPPETYTALLVHFGGQDVPIGLSRRPARGSLGSWLRAQLGVELAVAYVGPILVREGAAERSGEATLRFR